MAGLRALPRKAGVLLSRILPPARSRHWNERRTICGFWALRLDRHSPLFDVVRNGNPPLDRLHFLRKFFTLFHFTDQASCLGRLWTRCFGASLGQSWGQFHTRRVRSRCPGLTVSRATIHRPPSDRIVETGRKNGSFKRFDELRCSRAFALSLVRNRATG